MPKPNTERNAEIIRRRRAGEFPTDIAKALGVSRNAVIGVCHKAGLHRFDQQASLKRHASRGEARHNALLTEETVGLIRSEYRRHSRDSGAVALARRFGVRPQTVWAVITGKSWAHVQ